MKSSSKQTIIDLINAAPSTDVESRVQYRSKTIVVVMACWNEQGKVEPCLKAIPKDIVDTVCVVDNASVDATRQEAIKAGAVVITHPVNLGAGGGYRTGYFYGRLKNFDIVVELAGDNQDDPSDIKHVIDHLLDNDLDYVQGSRWLSGGRAINMTFFRSVLTKVYSVCLSALFRSQITDATNGFRAFRTEILDDAEINLWQEWLLNYELEPYLLIKVISLGYRVGEAPVKKIYHQEMSKNTKMIPFVSWYSILRPLLFLPL